MTPQRGTVTVRRQRLPEGPDSRLSGRWHTFPHLDVRARSRLIFGRFAIFGEGVAESPQRFRLPANTHTLRAGPHGRMVAW